MIPQSYIGKALALCVAVAGHLGLAAIFFSQEKVEISGGAIGTSDVRLGARFEDLAALTEPVQSQSQPIETLQPKTLQAKTIKPQTVQPLSPRQPAAPLASLKPADPIATAPVLPAVTAQPASQVQPQVTPPAQEKVKATEPEAPKAKPQAKPVPKPKPAETPKPAQTPKPKANSAKNNVAGEATGKAEAPSKTKGNGAKATQKGNAAVSNYPGKVMRKLERTRRPSCRGGAARVYFAISGNGRLASASITQSSGDAATDKAILKFVKKAAPFPKPPAGAKVDYALTLRCQG